MATPFQDLIDELRKLAGHPKVTYPEGDGNYPTIERLLRIKRGSQAPTFGQADPDAGQFPTAVLTNHLEIGSDPQWAEAYRKWQRLPGADVLETSTEPDTGIAINKVTTIVALGTTGGVDYPATTNISAATVASNTVITVASTAGLRKGLQVTIASNSNCTPDIDGQHRIVSVGTGTVTIDFAVASVTSGGTGGTLALSAEVHREIIKGEGATDVQISSQVNTASLVTAGFTFSTQIDHTLPDLLHDLRAENEAGFTDAFESGMAFPIPTTLVRVSAYSSSPGVAPIVKNGASGKFDASIVTSYSYGPPDLTPATVSITGIAAQTLAISAISAATAAVVTVSSTAALVDGETYLIAGTNSTPVIDGARRITILSGTTFSVPITTSGTGSSGTVTYGAVVTVASTATLVGGRYYLFAGSNSTPTIDGQHPVTILTGTTFIVPVQTTGAGSAGTITAAVLRVRLSTGTCSLLAFSVRDQQSISIQAAGSTVETNSSQSNSNRESIVPNCLSGRWATDDLATATEETGIIAGGVKLWLAPSSPTHFVAGATFLLSDEVVKQRLGIYERRRVVLTVPVT